MIKIQPIFIKKLLGISENLSKKILIFLLFLFILLNMSSELHDPDIWLHLKTGEYIVNNKTIPGADIFSSTLSQKEWIDHSWLAQVIFYLIFRFGGPDYLIFFSSIVVLLAFLFLFFSVHGNQRSSLAVIILFFLTILSSAARFNIRPENFSILFFSIYLFILTNSIRKKHVFLLPLIQLIWVNTHGFFILGPIMLGLFILAEAAKKSGPLPLEWRNIEPIDNSSLQNLVIVFFLASLLCFVNPYGYNGALYPLRIILNFGEKSEIFYKYIAELLPPWEYSQIMNVNMSAYYLLAIVSLLSFFLNFRMINPALLALWIILFGMSFTITRNIIFFNFAAFLITADNLLKKYGFDKIDSVEKAVKKPLFLINYAFIFLLIISLAKENYYILNKKYYIFEENRKKSALLGIANSYPDRAIDFILTNSLPGNIFNLFNHGSYLIYRAFPKYKVFIDGRTELYGKTLFADYLKIRNADKETIERLFNKYDVNTVFLDDSEGEDIFPICNYLLNNRAWALVYFDKNSLIFLRDDPRTKALIGKLKLDLRNWQTATAKTEKIRFRTVIPDPYIKRAWKLYNLGFYEQAEKEAKEALRINPKTFQPYNILGLIALRERRYGQAFDNFRLSSTYSPKNKDTLISFGALYMEQNKFNDAILTYKKLTALNPYFSKGYFLLGRAYEKAGKTKLALDSFGMSVKLNPYMEKYFAALGSLLNKNGDLNGAAQIYKKAIDNGLNHRYFYKCLSIITKEINSKK